jgi:FdhD protein
MSALPDPAVTVKTLRVRGGAVEAGVRDIPEETAVAFVYDAAAEAVMMATPVDLEDFALGFSLTEGIIADAADIRELEIASQSEGIELRIWLRPERGQALSGRRRTRAGPTGCGLCGIESLQEAMRPAPRVASDHTVAATEIVEAMADLAGRQALNLATRAVHAAALHVPGEGIVAVREDAGRHNALDKLAGALARARRPAADGVVLMTSRLSVELVQKAAAIGAPILAAVSAPTALALRTAERCGITIVGVVRADGLEVFTHADRIVTGDGRRPISGA